MQKVTVRAEGIYYLLFQQKFGINTSVARLCLSMAEKTEAYRKGKGCVLKMGQMQAEYARLRTVMCLSGFRRMG